MRGACSKDLPMQDTVMLLQGQRSCGGVACTSLILMMGELANFLHTIMGSHGKAQNCLNLMTFSPPGDLLSSST